MAPKKNRIKVEQELQDESCPDRAPLPLKPGEAEPGATRRHRQKPKVLLRRVRTQVKVLRKDTAVLYTPLHPLALLVKEITESCPGQVRLTFEALLHLQDAADFYLNETFDVRLTSEEPEMAALGEGKKSSEVGACEEQGDGMVEDFSAESKAGI